MHREAEGKGYGTCDESIRTERSHSYNIYGRKEWRQCEEGKQ